MSERTCSVEGCERPYRCTGYCSPHYHRWLEHGDPQAHVPIRQRARGLECRIEGCSTPVRCKGLCSLHYDRVARSGNSDKPKPRKSPPCAVGDCNRRAIAHGWCSAHHQRVREHGDPLAHIPIRRMPNATERNDVVSRILAQSVHAGECLEWTGTVDAGGYGYIGWKRKSWRVHRVIWAEVVEPIQSGDWTVDHLCYNRRCINPDHLDLVSRGENTMRAMLRKFSGRTVLPDNVLDFLRQAAKELAIPEDLSA